MITHATRDIGDREARAHHFTIGAHIVAANNVGVDVAVTTDGFGCVGHARRVLQHARDVRRRAVDPQCGVLRRIVHVVDAVVSDIDDGVIGRNIREAATDQPRQVADAGWCRAIAGQLSCEDLVLHFVVQFALNITANPHDVRQGRNGGDVGFIDDEACVAVVEDVVPVLGLLTGQRGNAVLCRVDTGVAIDLHGNLDLARSRTLARLAIRRGQIVIQLVERVIVACVLQRGLGLRLRVKLGAASGVGPHQIAVGGQVVNRGHAVRFQLIQPCLLDRTGELHQMQRRTLAVALCAQHGGNSRLTDLGVEWRTIHVQHVVLLKRRSSGAGDLQQGALVAANQGIGVVLCHHRSLTQLLDTLRNRIQPWAIDAAGSTSGKHSQRAADKGRQVRFAHRNSPVSLNGWDSHTTKSDRNPFRHPTCQIRAIAADDIPIVSPTGSVRHPTNLHATACIRDDDCIALTKHRPRMPSGLRPGTGKRITEC
ncbi:MAG: hypothetical protein BWZ07_02533 [Alphaproteobacteria bacterium ADurb.BinA280]|nr:MAG: hypothetical protein BWZ07_02533 [Alphaproteobacteria bacterium ADurb.BinA280]